jgi:hypothetical protein
MNQKMKSKVKKEIEKFIQINEDTWKHPNGYTINLITNYRGEDCSFYDLVDANMFSVWDFETFEDCVIAMIDHEKDVKINL